MKLRFLTAACTVATLMLGGCFDSDDDETPLPPAAVTEVPASAGTSSAAFTTYVNGTLVAMTSETTEPLGVANLPTAPTSETDEPVAVN
jgi:hypothetical protein